MAKHREEVTEPILIDFYEAVYRHVVDSEEVRHVVDSEEARRERATEWLERIYPPGWMDSDLEQVQRAIRVLRLIAEVDGQEPGRHHPAHSPRIPVFVVESTPVHLEWADADFVARHLSAHEPGDVVDLAGSTNDKHALVLDVGNAGAIAINGTRDELSHLIRVAGMKLLKLENPL